MTTPAEDFDIDAGAGADDGDDSQDQTQRGESQNMRQLREHAKAQEARAKAAEAELTALREAQTKAAEDARKAEIADWGATEKQVELFLAASPEDQSREAFEKTMALYGIQVQAASGSDSDSADEQRSRAPEGFTPGVTGDGEAPGRRNLDVREVLDLPEAELAKLKDSGRLKLETLPGSPTREAGRQKMADVWGYDNFDGWNIDPTTGKRDSIQKDIYKK